MNRAIRDHYRGGGALPERLANSMDLDQEEKGVTSILIILGVPIVLMLVIVFILMSAW